MRLSALFLLAGAVWADDDAAAIMAKVAANHESATEARRQYVYQQKVRSSLVRSSGEVARREKRAYSVFPGEKGTEKKLTSFSGEYRKGKRMIAYSEPGFKYKGLDIDGDLIRDLTDDLTNEKDSRDGIPKSLFPLDGKALDKYDFTLKGEIKHKGRRAYRIAFEPRRRSACVNIGSDEECDAGSWKGEALIDAAEFQPVSIQTELDFKMPWGVKVFLGTNLRQTGFSIKYVRVAENVWFPSTYGTEFRLDVLWSYKRTITLSLENGEFQKTEANSTIRYGDEDGRR